MQPGGSDLVKSRNRQSLPTSSSTTGIQARHPRSQLLRFSVELSVSLGQYVRSQLVLLACRPDPCRACVLVFRALPVGLSPSLRGQLPLGSRNVRGRDHYSS